MDEALGREPQDTHTFKFTLVCLPIITSFSTLAVCDSQSYQCFILLLRKMKAVVKLVELVKTEEYIKENH